MSTALTNPGHVAVVLSALLTLAGCAGPKGQYLAAADAQQRMAAETTATQKSAASIDTQSTYLKLVEQMQTDGLWFASLAHIDALEQRWGVSPESSRMRADALRQTGESSRSEDTYKRLIGTPLEAAGYHGLGLLAGARGDYAEAVRLLKEAQRRNPTDAVLLSDLGYASLRAGLVAEARLPLMQALQLRSESFATGCYSRFAWAFRTQPKTVPARRCAISQLFRRGGTMRRRSQRSASAGYRSR